MILIVVLVIGAVALFAFLTLAGWPPDGGAT